MITINPFAVLSNSVPSVVIQVFVIVMIILVIVGTIFEMIHKKNVQYFFQNAKKARESGVDIIVSGTTVFKENGGNLKKKYSIT